MVWLENLPDDWWKSYQSNSLSPQCIQELDIELLFLIRSLLLETRTRLLTSDFQHALYARNIHRSVSSKKNIKQLEDSMISISLMIE
jgi:hypothetical protein